MITQKPGLFKKPGRSSIYYLGFSPVRLSRPGFRLVIYTGAVAPEARSQADPGNEVKREIFSPLPASCRGGPPWPPS